MLRRPVFVSRSVMTQKALDWGEGEKRGGKEGVGEEMGEGEGMGRQRAERNVWKLRAIKKTKSMQNVPHKLHTSYILFIFHYLEWLESS